MTVMNEAIASKPKSKAALFGAKACNSIGTFFGVSRAMEYIRPGSLFHRVHEDKTVETARVLAVATDMLGIPHVRYELVIERAHRRFVDEPRILALKTFADTYKEYV